MRRQRQKWRERPQARKQGLLGAIRSRKKQGGFFPPDFAGSVALPTLDFRLLASITVRRYISVVLSYPVLGGGYSGPRKLTHVIKVSAWLRNMNSWRGQCMWRPRELSIHTSCGLYDGPVR